VLLVFSPNGRDKSLVHDLRLQSAKMAAPVGLDQPVFFSGPNYQSTKPGYVWRDSSAARGEGIYKEFDPAAAFQGSRPGFVFRSGPKGLGYYVDLPLAEYLKSEEHACFMENVAPSAEGADEESDEEGYKWENAWESDDDADAKPDQEGDGFEDTMKIKSACPACHSPNGETRILVREYPFFGQIVISSFECSDCGHRNNEAKPSGDVKEKGVKMTVTVATKRDLNREVVISRFTDIEVPHLGLQIPCNPSKTEGRLTTLEGVLQGLTVMLDASAKQYEAAAAADSTNEDVATRASRLRKMVGDLAHCAAGTTPSLPFSVVLDDCSGVAAVENPSAPEPDAGCVVESYTRTPEQDEKTCCVRATNEDESAEKKARDEMKKRLEARREKRIGRLVKPDDISRLYVAADGRDVRFPVECGVCGGRAENRMAITNVPHFQDIMLMCIVCDHCGYKDAEVKTSGAIAAQGKRITVHVTPENAMDILQRDVLKSPDCHVAVPEIGLELNRGTLGGIYTTVEGLLSQTRDQLREVSSHFFSGDSASPEARKKFEDFFAEIEQALAGELAFTMVMSDPTAGSWVYNPKHPVPDPAVEVELYERTEEENEELGLNQMYTPEYDDMGNVIEGTDGPATPGEAMTQAKSVAADASGFRE
jgi:zinc finger protein